MNPKQPFYVDVGTSVVAIRCASNRDVIEQYDYVSHPHTLKLAEDICDRMNREVKIRNSGDRVKLRDALDRLAITSESFLRTHSGQSYADTMEALDKAHAALAAPARNCDMPLIVEGPADNNADKAWLVFKRHNPDVYFDVSGLLRCIDWLLAPATEGGAK